MTTTAGRDMLNEIRRLSDALEQEKRQRAIDAAKYELEIQNLNAEIVDNNIEIGDLNHRLRE